MLAYKVVALEPGILLDHDERFEESGELQGRNFYLPFATL